MILPAFRLHRPTSLDEALDVAGSCDGDFDYIGGGTDLLPNYKNRLNSRSNVIRRVLVSAYSAGTSGLA